jgi:multidrug resistance protein MdtO
LSRDSVISAIGWEDHLLQFLRAELAPTPGRARAAARIVVACVVATLLIMTMHSPHGSFIIITIFVTSLANAGASVAKAAWRILGTTVGAAVGLSAYIAFLDHPWLRVAMLGPLAAFFIFISQTTSTPYFGLLGGITAVLIMTVSGADADTGVHIGLWRFAMIALGAVIASAAQIILWPDDPEELLRATLEKRLSAIKELLAAIKESRQPDTAAAEELLLTGLSRQLDLLDQAEARYLSLRQRHAEQLALIGGVEQLLTAAVAFAVAVRERGAVASPPAKQRLAAIAADCARLSHALRTRQPAEINASSGSLPSDAAVAASGSAALLPGLLEMERILDLLPEATGFLDRDRHPRPVAPLIRALDSPARAPFFTQAFSLFNTHAIGFSLRTGLAATLSYVICQGLAWPGLATSIWTTLLIAQPTVGASVQKAILRLVGSAVGGLMGLVAILWAMPNMDSLPPLLVVVAVGTGLAAWVTAGSARISYVGIQMGLAFGLSFLNDLGPTTDLVPARDRVIGVLLGIVVSAFVFSLGGSILAGTAMRRSLSSTIRSLAGLSRVGLRGDASSATIGPARGWRWKVYQDLNATLRLNDESKYEWGAGLADAEAERTQVAHAATDAQGVFLALLALVHHRLSIDLSSMPPDLHARFQALAQGVVLRLAAVADRVEGKLEPPTPDPASLLARVQEAAGDALPTLEATISAHLPGRIALYEDLLARIAQLDRDAKLHPRKPETHPYSSPDLSRKAFKT